MFDMMGVIENSKEVKKKLKMKQIWKITKFLEKNAWKILKVFDFY